MRSFVFKFEGFKELIADLGLRAGKVRYAQGALRKLATEEVKNAQHRIMVTKQSPDGDNWIEWAQSTRLGRERKGNAGKGLLWDSGNLLRSFKIDINTSDVVISNTAPYANYLQEGTNKMPARPFLGWSKESLERANYIFNDYLKQVIIEGKDYK